MGFESMTAKPDRFATARPAGIPQGLHLQPTGRAYLLLPAGLTILGLGFVVYGLGDSRVKLIVAAIDACVVCSFAYFTVGRLQPRYWAPRLLLVSYALQFLTLAAIAIVGLPLSPPYHPFQINAADAPIRAVVAMLTVPAGTVIAAVAWWFFARRSPVIVESSQRDDAAASQRRVYLIFAALAHLAYWPATLENAGVLGYIVRVVATALIVAPFLAGRDSRHDRGLAAMWCSVVLINAVIGISAGTRSKALIAAVLFAAGYVSALTRRQRIVVGAVAMLAVIPLIQFAGAVGVVRDRLGRGGFELMQSDHVREVFRELSLELSTSDQLDADAINNQGLGRLVAWTNVVVPLMTPETVPYRGMDGLFDEARKTFQVASISGLTADDLYDTGLFAAPARIYGFTISSNTAVEFTLAADAWSRGGALAAILFSFIAVLAMTVAELCAHHLQRFGPGVATVLALPVTKAALLDANTVPLLPMLRGMVLSMFAIALIAILIELLRHPVQSLGRRPAARLPIAARTAR
jgi:hypothetical protein